MANKNRQEKEQEFIDNPIQAPDYSDKELSYRGFLIKRLTYAKNQRMNKWDELDGMDYVTYYDTNAKAGNSFNPPKQNQQDTRIVTGTTLEKENSLLNSLLNLNFEPDVEAFDNDDLPVVVLGSSMEAMIKKSRIIEDYEDIKRRLIYKELLDQGTTFVEEVENQYLVTEKDIDEESLEEMDPEKMKWSERRIKLYDECECNLLPGSMVFLGNIKEFIMDKQPFVYTVEYIPYDVAESRFGNWKRFKNVPKTIKQTVVTQKDSSDTTYRQWRLYDLMPEFVEVIKYQDKWSNEYMVMLNGEMMLRPGYPLSSISGGCWYTISKGDIEPITAQFAYSKSFPAKTKVAQAVLDEFLRLFILKTQKSVMPPMANRSAQILSKKIFFPATITPNLNPDDLKEIGVNQGMTSGEAAGYQLVKTVVDEMTVSSQFQGLETKTKTATQTLEDKKQNLIKIGMAVLGVRDLERQICYKRLYNILKVWTKPIDQEIDETKDELKNIYRSISVPAEFDGSTGVRQVVMTDENYKTGEEVMQEEDNYKLETGSNLQRIYLNPKILKMIKTKWYIEIVQTDKNTSEYKKLLFLNNLKEAMTIWGPQAVNLNALKSRWAQLSEEDEDIFFVKDQGSMPMIDGMQPGAGGTGMIQGMMPGTDNLIGQAANAGQ